MSAMNDYIIEHGIEIEDPIDDSEAPDAVDIIIEIANLKPKKEEEF